MRATVRSCDCTRGRFAPCGASFADEDKVFFFEATCEEVDALNGLNARLNFVHPVVFLVS